MQLSSILALVAAAAGIVHAQDGWYEKHQDDQVRACSGKGIGASCRYVADYIYDGYDGDRYHVVCDGASQCASRSGELNDDSQGGINQNMCQTCPASGCCTETNLGTWVHYD
ncbi:uncharacterized protein RHO25_001588 [Cercospora beticola]|uniref:Uncharacterized protein n=1 Tax=Cercospora beticola TaxID=122368 RepID=A0ABZ0NBR9_CERBT|nr:hypothetical protein RHO25_001588 [Cercospora beticola]